MKNNKLTITKENIVLLAIKNIRNNKPNIDGKFLWDKYLNKDFVEDEDLCLAISDILVEKKDYVLTKMRLNKVSEINELIKMFKEKYSIKGLLPLKDVKKIK